MLEIEKLRLTSQERWDAQYAARVADAQLAKALWGVMDWFYDMWIVTSTTPSPNARWLWHEMAAQLKEAGIDHPSTAESQAPR